MGGLWAGFDADSRFVFYCAAGWRSALAVYAGTGHWPPYERPGEFAELHMNFMANGLDVVPSEHL